VEGVAERFYGTNIPRSLRRFVTLGRYSIYFQKRNCVIFYEQPLSNYPMHVCSGTCRLRQATTDTRAVEYAGADRHMKERVCLILSLAYLMTRSNCDESNMRMGVNDEQKTTRKRLWPILKFRPRSCIEGLRKAMKTDRAKNRTADIQVTKQLH
jgi:hypothetical protein